MYHRMSMSVSYTDIRGNDLLSPKNVARKAKSQQELANPSPVITPVSNGELEVIKYCFNEKETSFIAEM